MIANGSRIFTPIRNQINRPHSCCRMVMGSQMVMGWGWIHLHTFYKNKWVLGVHGNPGGAPSSSGGGVQAFTWDTPTTFIPVCLTAACKFRPLDWLWSVCASMDEERHFRTSPKAWFCVDDDLVHNSTSNSELSCRLERRFVWYTQRSTTMTVHGFHGFTPINGGSMPARMLRLNPYSSFAISKSTTRGYPWAPGCSGCSRCTRSSQKVSEWVYYDQNIDWNCKKDAPVIAMLVK